MLGSSPGTGDQINMSLEDRMKKEKEAWSMEEAGQIAYEVIGSRRKNEEDAHRGNYYHWKIKLVCAVCKHIREKEWPTGWMGQQDHCTGTIRCEGCDTELFVRKHTDWWLRHAKQGNILAQGVLKHYPR
jgi:hypothetical protein